ncbi:unnamed protein product [Calypogeia fissa]
MEEEKQIPLKKRRDRKSRRQEGSSEDDLLEEESTNKGSGKKAKQTAGEESSEENPVEKAMDKGSKKEVHAPSKVSEKKEYSKSQGEPLEEETDNEEDEGSEMDQDEGATKQEMFVELNRTLRARMDVVTKYVDETMLVLLKHIAHAESRVTIVEAKVTQYQRWEQVLDEDDTEIIQKLCTYEESIAHEHVTLMDLLKLIGVTDYTPGDDLSQGWVLVKEKVEVVLPAKENKDKDGIEILGSMQTGR